MNVSQKIKQALAYQNMSAAQLARVLGVTSQAFGQRLKTGKFTSEVLERIAAALGCVYFFGFEFPDGTKI